MRRGKWADDMKCGKWSDSVRSGKWSASMFMALKKPIRVLIVFGIVCLPILGCGKSGSEIDISETVTADSVLDVGASDIVTKIDADNAEENGTDTAIQNSVSDDPAENTSEKDMLGDPAGNTSGKDMQGDSAENTSGKDMQGNTVGNTSEKDVPGDASVDVDLTALSSTMVYSEVFQMMYYPEDYIGKTVKMEGLYDHFHDDSTGKDYYACIIQDATACCAQGIEFQLSDGEYPADSTSDVAVMGTFGIYEENGAKYCTLMDAELVE